VILSFGKNMTLKRVLTVVAVFTGTVVLLIGTAFVWMMLQYGGDGSGKKRETTNQQNDWVQEYMLRNLRSIAREGEGVRLQAALPENQIVYRAAGDRTDSFDNLRKGNSVLLVPGDYMVRYDHHGGQTYRIRQVLPDRVIVEYESSHSMMGNSSTDTGTVELAYRTSTPLNTIDVRRDNIAKQLAQQIKTLQPAADGKVVEMVVLSPQEFLIRSTEVSHRMDKKIAERSVLAVNDGIVFAKSDDWTLVSVKEILSSKVVFEYRSAFDYKGMKAQDQGILESVYR
jgi:hypothetical protein